MTLMMVRPREPFLAAVIDPHSDLVCVISVMRNTKCSLTTPKLPLRLRSAPNWSRVKAAGTTVGTTPQRPNTLFQSKSKMRPFQRSARRLVPFGFILKSQTGSVCCNYGAWTVRSGPDSDGPQPRRGSGHRRYLLRPNQTEARNLLPGMERRHLWRLMRIFSAFISHFETRSP